MNEVKEVLRSIGTGFCYLALILLGIALIIGLAIGFFYLMALLMWGSYILLGKTWCLIVWGFATVVVASYGIGKESRKYK